MHSTLPTRRNRFRSRCVRLSVVLFALFVVACVALRSRPPLESAVPLGGEHSNWNKKVGQFWWLTPTEALVADEGNQVWKLLHVNLAAGSAAQAPSSLSRDFIRAKAIPFVVHPSPDGHRLICHWMDVMDFLQNGFKKPSKWSCALLSVDGSHSLIPLPRATQSVWLPDGSGWIEDDGENGLQRVNIGPQASIRKEPTGGSLRGRLMGRGVDGNLIVSDLRYIPSGNSSPGRVESRIQRLPEESIEAYWSPNEPANISTPVPGDAHEEVLSPSGRQLLWLMEPSARDWRLGLPKLMQRLFGVRVGQRRWEVWLTDLEGGSKYSLGSMTTGRSARPREFAWSPDGQRISFIRDGVVWVMPAPQPN
jgi:hypothetical protein